MVCETWRVARSSVYALRAQIAGEQVQSRTPGKRGPKTALSDEELVGEIRTVLKGESIPRRGPPQGEGAACGQRDPGRQEPGAEADAGARAAGAGAAGASPRRPEPQRLDPHRAAGRTRGTDAARFCTKAEGWCWFFAAVDHCTSDVVGWHVAKKGDRWAALEPVRQGVRAHMGGFSKTIALGLGLRHDWGSLYRARQFQAEIKWLGIRSTPAYVGEPGVQRRRGALHPDVQGGMHLSAPLRNPRGGQSGDRGLHRTLQQRLAPPAARVHDPGPRPREAQPEGGLMSKSSTCPEYRNRYTPHNDQRAVGGTHLLRP